MNKIICGDALEELKKLSDQSVQMCVTSPPLAGVNGENLLIKIFSLIKNLFTHRSLFGRATTQSGLFRVFAFPKFKAENSLLSFNCQKWKKFLQDYRCNFVGGLITIHNFISMITSLSLVYFGVFIKRTSKLILKHL